MGTSDKILEKRTLSKQLFIWRVVAIVMIAAIFFLIYSKTKNFKNRPYIASISIFGEIFENHIREKKLAELAEDPRIKAVMIHISSPGGTSYGGESLYNSILDIKRKKPVVVVMGTLATSAAYMAALGSDHIIARNSTITASIGAIFMSPEFSELAKKLGVNFIVLKKGKLKADPLPFNGPINKEAKQMINSLLDNQYNMFFEMIVKHRKISKNKLAVIADGRIVTGSQAFEYGLIDQIGAEKEAYAWLASKSINVKALKTQEVSLYRSEGIGLLSFKDLKSVIMSLKNFLGIFSRSNVQV